jgi:hypothetical protein
LQDGDGIATSPSVAASSASLAFPLSAGVCVSRLAVVRGERELWFENCVARSGMETYTRCFSVWNRSELATAFALELDGAAAHKSEWEVSDYDTGEVLRPAQAWDACRAYAHDALRRLAEGDRDAVRHRDSRPSLLHIAAFGQRRVRLSFRPRQASRDSASAAEIEFQLIVVNLKNMNNQLQIMVHATLSAQVCFVFAVCLVYFC